MAELRDPAAELLDQRWEAEWNRNLLDAAMRRVKRRVKPKQFQMFDLCVTQQRPTA